MIIFTVTTYISLRGYAVRASNFAGVQTHTYRKVNSMHAFSIGNLRYIAVHYGQSIYALRKNGLSNDYDKKHTHLVVTPKNHRKVPQRTASLHSHLHSKPQKPAVHSGSLRQNRNRTTKAIQSIEASGNIRDSVVHWEIASKH